MKDEEKKLIENLFNRLKKTELNSSERDDEANSLIQDLVKKQPYSVYYMTQTILIQETAIKKLSLKVEELTNQISNFNKTTKKPSFLSSFFKKEPMSSEISNNIWEKNKNIPSSYHSLPVSSPAMGSSGNSSSNSGFLKNALQTATGVAGGMILGNMLMNVFNHSKPEEEIFDTVNESSISEEHEFHPNHEDHLVDYDNEDNFYASENTSNFNNFDDDHINEISDTNEISDMSDINDDNFI